MKNATRVIACLVIAIVFAIILTAIISSAGALTQSRPKCNKKCQGQNDWFFKPNEYTDFFVNDSDGKKDQVFAIYHNVPFPTAGEGVKCDVLKSFDAEGVTTNVVCPGRVITGSGSQSNNDEDNK